MDSEALNHNRQRSVLSPPLEAPARRPLATRKKQALRFSPAAAWLKGFPSLLFVCMALFYFLLTLAHLILNHGLTFGAFNLPGWVEAFTTSWRHQDAAYFLQIAREGYAEKHLAAFFPLYPILIRLTAWPLGNHFTLAAMVVSWLCSWGSYLWFYRLAAREYGKVVAHWALLFFAFCPLAFFSFAPYSEAVFLLVSIGAIERARAGHIWQAGLLGALGMLARPTGLLLLIPLSIEWGRRNASVMRAVDHLKQTLSRWGTAGPGNTRPSSWPPIWQQSTQPMKAQRPLARPRWEQPVSQFAAGRSPSLASVFSLALIPLTLLGYIGFLHTATGNPLAFLQAESLWNRHLTPPWETLALFLTSFQIASQRGTPSLYFTNTLDLVLVIGLPVLVLYSTLRHRRLWLGAALYQLAISLLLFAEPAHPLPNLPYKTLLSTPRFMLPAFPIFLLLGQLGKSRPRLALALLVGSALALALLTLRSLNGIFIA
jgi:hypothetical protein